MSNLSSEDVKDATPNESNICHQCQESIKTSQFIRVGKYRFHKHHFSCTVCNQALHGKRFHHKEGKFYCADDYVKNFCHTCRHCNEKIASGSVIQAFGHYYHPEHFVCAECTKPFENGKYYEYENHPFCEHDYFIRTAEKCEHCKEPVKEGDMVRVQGKVFHNQCLKCFHCGAPLAKTGSIFQKDNQVYCRNDYLNFFCKRCTACGDHILKHCVSVNEEYYHPDCLLCAVCKTKLSKYICIDGYLRCADHTENALPKFHCSVCSQVIDEQVVLSVGKKLHAHCFNCEFCGEKLQKKDAKMKDNKLCCNNCMMKKDGSSSSSSPSSSSVPPSPLPTPVHADGDKDRRRSSSRNDNNNHNGQNHSGPGGPGGPKLITSTPSSTASSAAASPLLQSQSRPKLTASVSPNPVPLTPSASASSIDKGGGGFGDKGGGFATRSPGANFLKDESKQQPPTPGSNEPRSKPRGDKRNSVKQPLGQKIEWRKGDLIGKGSFGKVFMGMNAATGELIAVKQVRLNTAEDHEEAKAIQSEITLMENLRHRNIVSLLGTEKNGNKLNILMEYVPGRSLDTLLETFGPFSERVMRVYTKQLLDALAYCHANHVVHRDIKGKNILVDTQGNLKLADFGSAKRFANVMSKDAPSLSYNYTPLWTAPEVLVGDYNSKVDIWSLGCVIIEMATAKPPWSEQNFENPFRALYHIGHSGAIPKLPENLSEIAIAFLYQCLQRDPDKRPSAKDLLRHEWLKGVEEDDETPAAAEESTYESPRAPPTPKGGASSSGRNSFGSSTDKDVKDTKSSSKTPSPAVSRPSSEKK